MQIILSIVISCQNTTRYLHSKRLIADKEIESMANDNTNLHSAKGVKDDEFYTTFETIAEELRHYTKHFNGKTILCNCDDPIESNFCKYFLLNFKRLKLRRLICTSYKDSKVAKINFNLFTQGRIKNLGYVLDVTEENVELIDSFQNHGVLIDGAVKALCGDGDFRSEECVKYLEQADIVVTNPPFSLFKELVALLMKYEKKFLLIGNQNALTYKEIFPLIQKNLVWTGYRFGDMKFRVPADSEPRATRFWIDSEGQKWRSLGNAMWLTNLDIDRRHQILKLTKHYSPEEYPKYDDYDAINVTRVDNIPIDYPGIMGVPITIINKYNSDQFELIGEANHGSDNEFDLFKPTINGKQLFKRILIRHKQPMAQINKRFKILDLFCGAGGFSYGIEKNPHFSTVIALDNDPNVRDTFRNNMPNCNVVIGDITSSSVKSDIIENSIRLGVNMIIGGPPCQGYSNKGKKLGLADPRNFLFREYLSLVKAIQPEIFIIENVKTILSTSNGWFKDEIVNAIKSLGYEVEYGVLNAMNFGVPQSRERAIFICSKGINIPLPEPTINVFTSVHDAISDIAYHESGEGTFEQDYQNPASSSYQRKMRKGCVKLYNHIASNHKKVAIDKLKMIPPEKGKEYIPMEMRGNQKFKTTWGRLKWSEVSPTIDTRFDAASNGTNNHPFLHRAITPREAARIQSFDDKFVFYGAKVHIRKQIGNAVPPLMAHAIANQIYEVVTQKNK